ncbi:MAG: hypothetical protein HQL90_05195 [Magnetococcales bacterium]|nr:hypothetical protein [Magnetococcales bacterium]
MKSKKRLKKGSTRNKRSTKIKTVKNANGKQSVLKRLATLEQEFVAFKTAIGSQLENVINKTTTTS